MEFFAPNTIWHLWFKSQIEFISTLHPTSHSFKKRLPQHKISFHYILYSTVRAICTFFTVSISSHLFMKRLAQLDILVLTRGICSAFGHLCSYIFFFLSLIITGQVFSSWSFVYRQPSHYIFPQAICHLLISFKPCSMLNLNICSFWPFSPASMTLLFSNFYFFF